MHTMIQIQIPFLEQELLLSKLFPELDSVLRPHLQALRCRHDSTVAKMMFSDAQMKTVEDLYIHNEERVTQWPQVMSRPMSSSLHEAGRARCCVNVCRVLANDKEQRLEADLGVRSATSGDLCAQTSAIILAKCVARILIFDCSCWSSFRRPGPTESCIARTLEKSRRH